MNTAAFSYSVSSTVAWAMTFSYDATESENLAPLHFPEVSTWPANKAVRIDRPLIVSPTIFPYSGNDFSFLMQNVCVALSE